MRRYQTLYTRTPKRTRNKSKSSVGAVLVILSVLGLVLGVALTKVYLEHRTQVMGYEWEEKNRELNELLKEEINLTMQREELTSGTYILPKAESLGLQPPVPGQIRRVWGDEAPSEVTSSL